VYLWEGCPVQLGSSSDTNRLAFTVVVKDWLNRNQVPNNVRMVKCIPGIYAIPELGPNPLVMLVCLLIHTLILLQPIARLRPWE
jgi:hypothetical protein